MEVAREGEDGSAGPEDVGGGGVGVDLRTARHQRLPKQAARNRMHLGRIEEQVGDPAAVDVVVLLRDVGEDDAVGDFRTGPLERHLLEVRLAWRREAEQPEDRVAVLGEDREPDAEDVGVDLLDRDRQSRTVKAGDVQRTL